MRLSFIIHRVFHEEITSTLPLIKIQPKKFSQRPADGPITVTQQRALQPLMDLKIPPLHDSVLPFTLQVTDKLCPTPLRETMDRSHTKVQTVSLISVDWVTVLSADRL